jgi:hypothetical protein
VLLPGDAVGAAGASSVKSKTPSETAGAGAVDFWNSAGTMGCRGDGLASEMNRTPSVTGGGCFRRSLAGAGAASAAALGCTIITGTAAFGIGRGASLAGIVTILGIEGIEASGSVLIGGGALDAAGSVFFGAGALDGAVEDVCRGGVLLPDDAVGAAGASLVKSGTPSETAGAGGVDFGNATGTTGCGAGGLASEMNRTPSVAGAGRPFVTVGFGVERSGTASAGNRLHFVG